MSLSTDQENESCFKLCVLSQVWCMWLDACTRWAVSTVLCACGRSTVTTRWWTAGRAWAACRTVDRRSGPLCSTDSCTLLEALTAAQVCCYAFFYLCGRDISVWRQMSFKNVTAENFQNVWLLYFWLTLCVFAGLSTVEAYNAKTDEWFHVAPMSTRRSSVGVGVVNGEYDSQTKISF